MVTTAWRGRSPLSHASGITCIAWSRLTPREGVGGGGPDRCRRVLVPVDDAPHEVVGEGVGDLDRGEAATRCEAVVDEEAAVDFRSHAVVPPLEEVLALLADPFDE